MYEDIWYCILLQSDYEHWLPFSLTCKICYNLAYNHLEPTVKAVYHFDSYSLKDLIFTYNHLKIETTPYIGMPVCNLYILGSDNYIYGCGKNAKDNLPIQVNDIWYKLESSMNIKKFLMRDKSELVFMTYDDKWYCIEESTLTQEEKIDNIIDISSDIYLDNTGKIHNFNHPNLLNKLQKFIAITIDDIFLLALTSNGDVHYVNNEEIIWKNIIEISTGYNYALALNINGSVYILHRNGGNYEHISLNERIVNITSAYDRCYIITKSGKVYGMGCNNFYNLGLDHDSPNNMELIPINDHIINIVCSVNRTMFVAASGKLYVCGINRDNCLGFINNEDVKLTELLLPFKV